jgi:uncharacterized protein YbjT (DUF2867 family)
MAQRVLVIGATGLLGEPVARGFADAGFSVRVMSRNAGRARTKFPQPFEVFEGNGLKRTDAERALNGCDAVHISIDHEHEDECVTHVVEAGKAQKLKRITYVSGTTVCEENRWFPLVDRKMKSEHAIVASGIDYTIFCPGWFMEMLARFVRDGRGMVFGKPWRRWHFVSVQDFARMVIESYRRPQALTVLEALKAYRRALHPEVKTILRVPYSALRLIAWFSGDAELRAGVNMVSYLEKVGERGDPAEANAILGAPQLTLQQWLQTQKNP